MPFAIYRTEKIKSVGALAASAAHNARTRCTPNADPKITPLNCQLHGFDHVPTPDELTAEWRRRVENVKRKPDAVLAQELFLGTSPEFYDGLSDPEKKIRRDAWEDRSMRWLRREFGANLMSATLHLDETTPHISAYVVPVLPAKDGTKWLSAKKLFNPDTLVRQQDGYADAVKEIGLERGIRGSKATHQTISAFYGQLHGHAAAVADLEAAARRELMAEIPEKRWFESAKSHAERVEETMREHAVSVANAAEKLTSVAKDSTALRRALAGQQATNKCLSRELAEAKSTVKNLADQMRDIPLDAVMERLGFGDPKREGSSLVWRTGEHVVVVDGVKWYDHKASRGGGKAIDLVMHVMACPFGDAVGWLAGQWSSSDVAAAIRSGASSGVATVPRKSFPDLWSYYARPNAEATQHVRQYLSDRRAMSPRIVDKAIADGLVHGSCQICRDGSRRIWSVFRHIDASGQTLGASLRSVDDIEGGKRTLGDKLNCFFSFGQPFGAAHHVALVESPIDAMSYVSLYPRARAVSVAGASIPPSVVQILSKCTGPIGLALDGDAAGQNGCSRFTRWLATEAPALTHRVQRLTPNLGNEVYKDWNEMLVSKTFVRNCGTNLQIDPRVVTREMDR